MLLIKRFRIGSVTGPWSAVLALGQSPMSAALVRGQRPRTNTADQGPVTEPIRNHLINDIFIN